MKTNLKKRTIMLVISASIATMSLTLFAAPVTNTNIFINGEQRAVGFIEDGKTYIPLRDVSEALGATVDWAAQTKTVTIQKDGTTIIQKIGQTTATVNGKTIDAGAPAQIKNSKTYVPLRFVSETLGTTVNWDAKTRSVQITAQGAPSKGEASKDKWEDLVINAKLASSFPTVPVTNYTTMDKVPTGNVMGVTGTLFHTYAPIEQSQLPIRLDNLNSIMAIDTKINADGYRVLVLTLEVSHRNQANGFYYATKKKGFLTNVSVANTNTTKTIQELNVRGEKTFIITQEFHLPDQAYDGVNYKDVEGIVFSQILRDSAIMIKVKL